MNRTSPESATGGEAAGGVAPHLDGYYCDCTSLNEAVFKSTGNHDLIYAGLNCTTKLNACATLKHMCEHNSTCQSVMGNNSSEQDIQCLCKPGYTGKYCQFVTTFRMDASYSVQYALARSAASLFHLKFDVRVHFFRWPRMPLVYLKDEVNSLVVAVDIDRFSISVNNPLVGLDERLGFFYAAAPVNSSFEPAVWSTVEIFAIDARSLKLVYSV